MILHLPPDLSGQALADFAFANGYVIKVRKPGELELAPMPSPTAPQIQHISVYLRRAQAAINGGRPRLEVVK